MKKNIYLLNGPNLNLLGIRQPDVYGYDTLNKVTESCNDIAQLNNMTLTCHQSNYEGQLIDWVQEAREKADAIIINPGAYSHTSVALLDALNAFSGPVIEVHVSNIHAREDFRHSSFISRRADGIIIGLGIKGYEMALEALNRIL